VATFAIVLIVRDAVLKLWGPEDLLGPRAPGMKGAIDVLGRHLPSYDLFLIFVGPAVLLLLWLLLRRTRLGILIRAATQDREMVGALGVNQKWLFTGIFALGSALAALVGALQMAREPANRGRQRRSIRRRGRGWHGKHPWRVPRGTAHRRDQGDLLRHRHRARARHRVRVFEADARRRVPGDGRGADLAALGPPGKTARSRARS